MKTISVLGNNSGRNAGDAAILGNLLRDISALYDDVLFTIPTTHPGFVKSTFKQFNIKPVPLLPWYGSIKNFGLPLAWSMLTSDLVLICDNILFDRKFYNPLFNNLSSIALIAPYCKKREIPIVLYNVSIGPIDFPVGKKALQRVLDASPLIITRDTQTVELLRDLNLRCPEIKEHADCALNTTPSDEGRLQRIIETEKLFKNTHGTVGFNVHAYIDNWSKTGTFSQDAFCRTIGESVDKVVESLGVDIIFFVTQVMDIEITNKCINYSNNKNKVRVVSNQKYGYEDIVGLLQKVDLLIGLRTHTLIFSAAACTPMIGIASYPKIRGFLRTVGQEDKLVSFDNLTPDYISEKAGDVWRSKDEIRQRLKPLVAREKQKAKSSAKYLQAFLN